MKILTTTVKFILNKVTAVAQWITAYRNRHQERLTAHDMEVDIVGDEIENLLNQWADGSISKKEAFDRIKHLQASISSNDEA